jgi:hypothetical protein
MPNFRLCFAFVAPTKAGAQGNHCSLALDSRVRGNDEENGNF